MHGAPTNEKRLQAACSTTVDELICPISHDLPLHPVFAEDGFVYERKCIKQWLKKKRTSPRTNRPIGSRVFEAVQVKNIIEQMVRSGALPEGKGTMWKKRIQDEDRIEELRRRSGGGDADAMYRLGKSYENGSKSLSVNHGEKVKWYQEAAKRGHAKAMSRLGVAHEHGEGVEQSDVMAMYWYMFAAGKGDSSAKVYLGMNFAGGLCGCPKDSERALQWFTEAAGQGDPEGCLYLGKCLERGVGAARDLASARQWLQQAAPHSRRASKLLRRLSGGAAPEKEGWSEESNSSTSEEGTSSE